MGGGNVVPATPQEAQDIEMLNSMMGGSLDPAHALRLLRKYSNNLEKAAAALLEGDTGEDDLGAYADMPNLEPLGATTVGPRTPPRTPSSRPENPVIDLTKDDDDKELARALKASLEEGMTTFGPSNRAPDPNWAMVPSNAEVSAPPGMSQDDQAMSRAIEASLSATIGEDLYEEQPLEERVRKGHTPIALRPTSSDFVYAALVLHALFFVPQVRNAIAEWLPKPESGPSEANVANIVPPNASPGLEVWALLELFANMDLARMSELSVDTLMNAFMAQRWENPAERPGDASFRFYEKLASTVEYVLQYDNLQNPEQKQSRLFSLHYGPPDAEPDDPSRDSLRCLKVSVGANPDANDLVSSLATDLAPDLTKFPSAKRQVIMEPSEVISFQLLRDAAPPPYDAAVGRRSERATFRYPKSVYLDQFMKDSYHIADEKRAEQRRLLQEVKDLETKKKQLLHFNDKDTLADLQSSLHYYEHVAESDGDPARAEEIRQTAEKLKQIIDRVTAEAKAIDANISKLNAEASNMLDCPELRKHRYDLRAVIVHDGLFGRSHLYSYVKYKGKWWKTVDYTVSEVNEDVVLNDPTGLHLAAGPYFLLYSRGLTEEEEDARAPWQESLKDSVKHNNRMFFEQLPPEVASQVEDPNSPPSSPHIYATPSEHTIESDIVEPPESRGEPMDETE
ncbi:hypothetical protein GY45DRAFT_1412263 [Cubamyces sp. BRFM 1775]|nr:hypothetical protein GY45DRAFT_1412263 [Cubamyces sp. BRFM 1775]